MAEKVQDADASIPASSLAALTPEERDRFYELFNQLRKAHDPEERKRIKEELAKLTYGC